jgi:hypothetical protein
MKSSQSLPIVYDAGAGKFSFWLPVSICDNLLLSYPSKQGILVCHKRKEKLDEFAIKIIKLYTASQLLQNKTKRVKRTKVTSAVIVFSVLIVSAFFSNSLFQNYPTLKLPLSIGGAIIAMYCCYIFLTNYILGGLSGNDGDASIHRLALVELQKQLKEEFSC